MVGLKQSVTKQIIMNIQFNKKEPLLVTNHLDCLEFCRQLNN